MSIDLMDGDAAYTVARSSRPHEDHAHNGCSDRGGTDLDILCFILQTDAEHRQINTCQNA